MDNETTCISGSWVLDLTRSDTLEGLLRCMQAPEHVIRTQIAGEQVVQSRNVIAVQADRVVIHKSTLVNNFTEIRPFGADLVTQTDFGERRSMISLVRPEDKTGLVITTTSPTAHDELYMVEVRQLIDDGMAHTQEVNVQNLTTDECHTTRRTWRRVSTNESDIRSIFD